MNLNELATTPEAKIALWRETLAQLRHLSDDVWRGLKCFLPLNVALLLMVGVLFAWPSPGKKTAVLATILAGFGVVLTLMGRYIFKRHRIYYLQMLAKKTLIEHELGFYEIKLGQGDSDLAFPWRLAPEVVAEIKMDATAWVQKSIRGPRTIAHVQFLLYDLLLGLHCAGLSAAIFILLR